MKPEIRWPLLIIGLLVLQVGLGIFFFFKATSDPSFAVEEDYYQKAINWEDKQAQDRTNAKLGWTLTPVVGPVGKDLKSRLVRAELADRDGNPLSGAVIGLETFHNIRAGEILRADLPETSPGLYGADLRMQRPGLWEIRFLVKKGSDTFTHTARVHVAR